MGMDRVNILKISLQENEMVKNELEKLPANASVFRSFGNIIVPISKNDALNVVNERKAYINGVLNEAQ